MKMMLKKSVSVLLVLVTLFGMLSMSAAAATTYENDLPTVYLVGATQTVYKNGKQVWPVKEGIDEILLDNRNELLSAFTSSLMSSDWSIYGDALGETLDKYYSAGRLDNNGNPKKGTDIKHSKTPTEKTSNFGLKDYMFNYDPRLDPWETAVELKEYIDDVLAATGKKKVNLIGRCMGACFISAYLCRYGRSKVDTVIYYASAAKGSKICSELFSGKLNFDTATINNYASEYMGDDEISALLGAIVNVTYTLNMLGMGTDFASDIFEQLSVEVFPDLLRRTYANMPSYWAMVGEDDYEDAKNYIFGGYEEEYAGLIKKIDNYHNKVKVPLDKKLKQYRSDGMKIAVIAKYNVPFLPLIESSNVQADGKVDITETSFGATAAEYGKTFTVDYLNEAKEKGTIDYVSDDLIVDASSCLFPNMTWFIRDIDHSEIPKVIDTLMLKILRSKGQKSVRSFEEYPRFTSYDSETGKLTPITGTIPSGTTGNEGGGLSNLLSVFSSFFTIILNVIKLLIKQTV